MNNITTQGYFIKRLRDCGFIVIKLFHDYSYTDPRKWTILLNPGRESVLITCYCNKTNYREIIFEINDGGNKVPKNYHLSTDSMEVIISFLIKHNISNHVEFDDPYNKIVKKI
jgi:hypothetical protein